MLFSDILLVCGVRNGVCNVASPTNLLMTSGVLVVVLVLVFVFVLVLVLLVRGPLDCLTVVFVRVQFACCVSARLRVPC